MLKTLLLFLLISTSSLAQVSDSADQILFRSFGSEFLWGTASAAYQIEGAYNVDGRGNSIWDVFAEKEK